MLFCLVSVFGVWLRVIWFGVLRGGWLALVVALVVVFDFVFDCGLVWYCSVLVICVFGFWFGFWLVCSVLGFLLVLCFVLVVFAFCFVGIVSLLGCACCLDWLTPPGVLFVCGLCLCVFWWVLCFACGLRICLCFGLFGVFADSVALLFLSLRFVDYLF